MAGSTLQLNIRLDPDLDRAIENYRKAQDRIPTRTDAVKALLKEALTAHGYLAADPPPAPDERTG